MNTKPLVTRNPAFAGCPSCGKYNTLHRSRNRNWREHSINHLTFLKTYRCKQCGWRGYLSSLTITIKLIKNIFLYLALGAGAALIVREVLKRFV